MNGYCREKLRVRHLWELTPTRDQERLYPYNINTIESKQVMRIKKNINKGILSWSDSKLSELTWRPLGHQGESVP